MGDINQCAWKLVIPSEFVMGMEAERCGLQADVKILRPQRKTDLYLCEDHLNSFIKEWGLHYEIEILWEETTEEWKEFLFERQICTDIGCKKCLQDDPKTWRHS